MKMDISVEIQNSAYNAASENNQTCPVYPFFKHNLSLINSIAYFALCCQDPYQGITEGLKSLYVATKGFLEAVLYKRTYRFSHSGALARV